MIPRFILKFSCLMRLGLTLATAQPICTPNLTPEQAFSLLKNPTNQPTQISQPVPMSSIAAQTTTNPPILQTTSTLINLNTATEAELVQLNGISSKKAQAILLYREMIAPFHSVDDLDNVKGIGKATIEKNRSIMTVGDGKTVTK